MKLDEVLQNLDIELFPVYTHRVTELAPAHTHTHTHSLRYTTIFHSDCRVA